MEGAAVWTLIGVLGGTNVGLLGAVLHLVVSMREELREGFAAQGERIDRLTARLDAHLESHNH